MAVEEFPAELTAEETRECRTGAAGVRGAQARADARASISGMNAGGRVLLPRGEHAAGDDGTSLIPQAAAAAGMDFPVLCERIVRLALGEQERT